jgi:hypothetical protein
MFLICEVVHYFWRSFHDTSNGLRLHNRKIFLELLCTMESVYGMRFEYFFTSIPR